MIYEHIYLKFLSLVMNVGMFERDIHDQLIKKSCLILIIVYMYVLLMTEHCKLNKALYYSCTIWEGRLHLIWKTQLEAH